MAKNKKGVEEMSLETNSKITWCPGCFNFQILNGIKKVLKNKDLKKFAIVTGIGCHGKMFDYLNIWNKHITWKSSSYYAWNKNRKS